MILGFIFGLILGALAMNIAVEKERKVNERLRKMITNLEKDLNNANFKIECRDKKIELINKIKQLLEINKYDNEKVVLNKIKELVHDY